MNDGLRESALSENMIVDAENVANEIGEPGDPRREAVIRLTYAARIAMNHAMNHKERAAAREPSAVYRYQQVGDVLGYFAHKHSVDEPLWLSRREKRLVAEAWGLGRMTMYADRELCRSCFGVGGKSLSEPCPTCKG